MTEGVLKYVGVDMVAIDDKEYSLSPIVKPEYIRNIKIGSYVTFSVDKVDPNLITYLANASQVKKTYNPADKRGYSSSNQFVPLSDSRQDIISKQWAMNAAIEALKVIEKKDNSETFTLIKALAKQFYDHVKLDWNK
jgi:PDZ domain-containing secreted protein